METKVIYNKALHKLFVYVKATKRSEFCYVSDFSCDTYERTENFVLAYDCSKNVVGHVSNVVECVEV